MRNHWFKICVSLLAAFSSLAAAQAPSTPPTVDHKQIVQQARQAYYSLRAAGLDEFQSTVKPNWELVLQNQLRADPERGQAALKLLNGLHFSVRMDKKGKVTLDHRSDTEPPNAQVRAGFDQIYGGIDQAVSGFFDSWSAFMLTSPFPSPESEYQLEDLGSQYRLTYKDGSADVVTLMSKDWVISEVKVTSPQFASTLQPRLKRTAQGFILAGYTADYRPTSGPGVVKLDMKIDYQSFNGMQLPSYLIADVLLDGSPTHMELSFSDYQVMNH